MHVDIFRSTWAETVVSEGEAEQHAADDLHKHIDSGCAGYTLSEIKAGTELFQFTFWNNHEDYAFAYFGTQSECMTMNDLAQKKIKMMKGDK